MILKRKRSGRARPDVIASSMYGITIRFYDELNGFIRKAFRERRSSMVFQGRRSLKDLIESLGVPHVEVDWATACDLPVDLSYIPRDGDNIDVYPEARNAPGQRGPGLRPACRQDPRFILDIHLAKLARMLRLLGFDTLHGSLTDDLLLAQAAQREERILLSRDKQLLMHRIVARGMYVRNILPDLQITEVLGRGDLWDLCRPFTRCRDCNGEIIPLGSRPGPGDDVPEGVRSWCREYHVCRGCGKIFWKGSHYERLSLSVSRIMAGRKGL